MVTPNPPIPNILNTTEVATPLSFGPARPAVLLPMRLETRFFAMADGSFELRIRVYPDRVHIDSHEPALTAEEITWGRHFWEQNWRAGTDPERLRTAWRQLADRFDPPRAGWVALTLKPLNPLDRLDTAVDPDKPLLKPPQFPSPATKAESWSRAPLARLLPNQWIALGYKNGQLVVNAKGNLIGDVPLPAGPDPSMNQSAAADQLAIDDGMKWMVDFDVAEQKGMGIRAKLTAPVAAAGLDFLLVMGIKDSPGGTTDWTPRLAELFNAHHYTDGLSFVPQGTPSNNTVDAPSGFSSADPGHEESYLAERTVPTSQTGDRSNADMLTTALGLANNRQVFLNVPNAAAKEQVDARQMNTALWQATLGYFLLQMLWGSETNQNPLSDGDIDWVRQHFIDYVRASGPLPSLRIGKQPYGILPVTSLTAWMAPVAQPSLYTRDIFLQGLLIKLRDIWRGNFPDVPRLGRTEDTAQQKGINRDLAEVLSMDGLSSNYSIRNLMGRHYLEHLWIFLTAGYYSDIWPPPPIDEFPPEPEPPEVEEPPEGLTPRQRIQWIQAQQRAQAAYVQAHNAWAAQVAAIQQQQINFIENKKAYTSSWWAALEQRTKPLFENTANVTWKPRLARGMFSPHVVKLDGALVQPVQNQLLSPNYIDSMLATRDLDKIRDQSIQQPPPAALLYLLLRHSMLLEYGNAASRLLVKKTLLTQAQRREQELVNMPPLPTSTIWEQLDKLITVPGETAPMQLKKYLLGFLASGEPDTAREPDLKTISEFRASLAHLKSLAAGRLEELMAGTLDLCSHRLDAWITSFATKRLAEMRNTNPTGVLFGGYGWVMNLKPAAAQVKVVPTPAGEQDPVFQLTNNPGFVHTPSLTQASAVAILRSGHLANAGNQNPNDLLSIDLSSERVRLATWLLDGVRQGQPLGALLGYRFERRLQEGRKAKFISGFREMAPLVARKLQQPNEPAPTEAVEAIAANNVADGLQLNSLWQETQTGTSVEISQKELAFFAKLLPATPTEKTELRFELNALNDSVDCVSDALLAESVYQVVRGNPLRSATTVESITGGETPPPELEVVRTPRTGIALTHRLVTLFSGEPLLPAHWASPGIPFRANAEPHLNALVGRLLPNPSNVRCVVDRLDPETGNVLESKELRLNQLRLTPLDFIYAVDGEGGQQAEIEQRIMYGIMRKADGFAPGSLLRVNHGRKPGWAAGDLGYGEFNELVRAARKLITGARAIDAGDLDLPERSTDFTVDTVELESRVASVEVWLRRTPNDFKALLLVPDTANLDSLRDLINRSGAFGVAGAVPLSAGGNSPEDRQTLLTQAASIQKELAQRVEQLTTLIAGFNAGTATTEQKRDHALARLRIVFGKGFLVLPRFTAANSAELEKALADSTKVQDGDPFASTTWFQRMARVRDAVGRLNATLNYSEAVNTGEKLNLSVAQLPYGATDRWVGLPLQAGQQLPGGKLSLVMQAAMPIDVRKPLAGLLIDEWVETVPSATETTGIALQYDRPNSTPPQNILIAVPPVVEVPWTVFSLQQVLLETLDLARIRAVDPDALDDVGHYLPAMYFAINTVGDTVSTDFTKIRS